MDQMQKAMAIKKAFDSLIAANFARQNLSDLISLQDGPVRPILQAEALRGGQTVPAVGTERCTGKLHIWDEQRLITPDGTTAGYNEGGKPNAAFLAPIQVSNTVGRFGKVAAVTDTESAIWTNGGAFTLADGELERAFAEALDFATDLKTREILDEIEWCWINGSALNNTATYVPASPSPYQGPVVSQFNGLLQILTGTQTNYGNATTIDASAAPYGGFFTELVLRDAGRKQAAQKTRYKPNMLLVSDGQMEVINSFRPSIITMGNEGLTGGGSVFKYNNGFSIVDVVYEPWLAAGTMVMCVTDLMKNAPLIPLGAEPLARTQTQLERMLTTEMSVSVRVQRAFTIVTNLPVQLSVRIRAF